MSRVYVTLLLIWLVRSILIVIIKMVTKLNSNLNTFSCRFSYKAIYAMSRIIYTYEFCFIVKAIVISLKTGLIIQSNSMSSLFVATPNVRLGTTWRSTYHVWIAITNRTTSTPLGSVQRLYHSLAFRFLTKMSRSFYSVYMWLMTIRVTPRILTRLQLTKKLTTENP